MLLLNFSHPLTPDQLAEVARLAGQPIARVVDIPSQLDLQQPLAPQVVALADAAGLTPQQWQIEPLLINLPSLNYSAAALLAELHGRMGYFPPVLRLRPVKDALPPRFEPAEILNLQALPDQARSRRAAWGTAKLGRSTLVPAHCALKRAHLKPSCGPNGGATER